ncbi:MAG: hypothetical protein KA210_10015 [Bacteroidia bacterium]|nr:hypothetical protein [Bacteroidia bacterium]
MKYYKSLMFIIASLSILACKKESNIVTIENEVKPNTEIDSFGYKLKNNPKLFLKYWEGMTFSDYIKVSDLLTKRGVLEKYNGIYNYSYIVDDCEVSLEPIFKNDILKGIKLARNIECIYPLFEKKYNLPKMVLKSNLIAYYRENNPKYKPESMYFDGVTNTNLPEVFIDKSSKLQPNKIQKLDTSNKELINTREEFYKDEFIVKNKDVVICFKQEKPIEENFKIYTYSLNESEEMAGYMKNINPLESFKDNGNNELKFVECNSKTRIVSEMSKNFMSITYFTKKEYLLQESEKKKKLILEINKKNLENQKRKNLKKRILDEI